MLSRIMEGKETSFETKGQFKKYLEALREAETDTEKFVALLMLSKGVKAGECGAADRKQIMDALGVSFFIRLIQTKNVPHGCSPLAFKSVAVSVLCGLSEDPITACSAEMEKIVPCLKEVITPVVREEMMDDKEVHRDVYSIIAKLTLTSKGAQMLLDSGYPVTLVQTLKCADEETVVMTLALLVLLQQQLGMAVWTGTDQAFTDLFAFLAHRIIDSEDESVFSLCEILTHSLYFAPESQTSILPSATCMQPLMKKLFSLLRSRVGVVQRQLVLALVNRLVLCLGLACLQPPVVSDNRWISLILNLTCIEIRMAVENTTEEELQRNVSILCSHYNILELLLRFLCDHDDDDLPLEASAFSQAHDAVLAACNGIFFLLQQIDSGALNIPLLDPVVVASVRMISAVTCLAFTEVKDSVTCVLPFLLKLCEVEVGLTSEAAAEGVCQQPGKQVASCSTILCAESSTGLATPDAVQMSESVSDEVKAIETSEIPDSQTSGLKEREAEGLVTVGMERLGILTSAYESACAQSSPLQAVSKAGAAHTVQVGSLAIGDHITEENTGGGAVAEVNPGARAAPAAACVHVDITEEEILPKKLEGLLKLIDIRSEIRGQTKFQSLQVIKWIVPALHFICQDEETRQVFMRLSGYDTLVHFVFQKKSLLVADADSTVVEQQLLLCQVLEVLMWLVKLDESLGHKENWQLLLEIVVTTVPKLGNTPREHVCKGFLIAIGLALVNGHRSCVRGIEQRRFVQNAITYTSEAAAGALLPNPPTAEGLTRDTEDSWLLSIEMLTSLVSQFPDVIDFILEMDFIQNITRILLQCKRSTDGQSVLVVLDFLETLVVTDNRAKRMVMENKGIELARMHGRLKLVKCLQQNSYQK